MNNNSNKTIKLCYKINNNQNYEYYELKPLEGQQKSFYKKAYIEEYENGEKLLYSYGTPVAYILPWGVFFRLWSGWSATSSQHLKAAIGRAISKQEWNRLETNRLAYDTDGSYTGWGIFSR